MLTKRRYTYDEWLTTPRNAARTELVDGDPVQRVATTPDHDAVVDEFRAWLREAQRAGYGRVLGGPASTLLDAASTRQNAREPDVFFVRQERRAIITSRSVEGVPDLVIEVLSPGNRADDLPGGAAWKDYERYGVPAYWIVDIETRRVAQYEWRDGRYGPPMLLTVQDTLQSPIFPGITLPVAQLFVNVLEPERSASARPASAGDRARGADPFAH